MRVKSGNRIVLVVDDEAFFRDLLRAALEREGYFVVEATDGAEALELLRNVSPDLIVCDEVMPHLSGLQMLRTLRERTQNRNIPFLLVTGFASAEWDGMRKTDEGFGILVKPFAPESLLTALRVLESNPPTSEV
jgi:CheY-like chemotaxis protein